MKSQTENLIDDMVRQALRPVGLFEAKMAKLCIERTGSLEQTWIVIEFVSEQQSRDYRKEGFWAHTNDADLHAGTRGYKYQDMRLSSGHLHGGICEFLNKEFKDAGEIKVRVFFFAMAGSEAPASLEGIANNAAPVQTAEAPAEESGT